jgi:hypothetical protein
MVGDSQRSLAGGRIGGMNELHPVGETGLTAGNHSHRWKCRTVVKNEWLQ